MQATAVETQGASRELAHDLFGLLAYLLKSSSDDLFAVLGDAGLSLTQMKLLHSLEGEPGASLKQAGGCVGLSLPAASRAIEGLHQRGLVERTEDEEDRRIKRVRLTPAGHEVLRRLNEARLSHLEQFAATLTDVERRRLIAALAPLLGREEIGACRPEGSRS